MFKGITFYWNFSIVVGIFPISRHKRTITGFKNLLGRGHGNFEMISKILPSACSKKHGFLL